MIQVTLSCDASGCEETVVLASDKRNDSDTVTEIDFGAYDGERPGGWVDGTWYAPEGWTQTPDNQVACPRHQLA